MNSIRPLITISILIAAGVFLYTKINETPARSVPGATDAAQSAPGVPPLGDMQPSGSANPSASLTPGPALGSAPMAPASAAPAWSGTMSDATQTTPPPAPAFPSASLNPDSMSKSSTPPAAAPSATPEAIGLPEIPKIPDLPPLPGGSEANGSMTTPGAPAIAAASGPMMEPADAAKTASGATAQPPMAPIPAGDDRYGSISAAPATITPPTASTPAAAPPTAATPTFAAEWPAIQTALSQQELGKAHQMLSQWYGNPSLSPGEAEQVQSLLNQLAGTVVYSTQSCLEPPYTAKTGDTLESIAKQYDVPWQLLAKINGIPASNQIQPGQQLKVIHGPFAATIDVGRNVLTLLVDGRYAGRFPVTIEPGQTVGEGTWTLEEKRSAPSGAMSPPPSSVYAAAGPAALDHELVLRKQGQSSDSKILPMNEALAERMSIVSGHLSAAAGSAIFVHPTIHLAQGDADEVADILSVGSQVTIKK